MYFFQSSDGCCFSFKALVVLTPCDKGKVLSLIQLDGTTASSVKSFSKKETWLQLILQCSDFKNLLLLDKNIKIKNSPIKGVLWDTSFCYTLSSIHHFKMISIAVIWKLVCLNVQKLFKIITKMHIYEYASNIYPRYLKHKFIFILFSTLSTAIYSVRLLK